MPTRFAHDLIKAVLLHRLLPIAMPIGCVTLGQAGVHMRNGNVRVPNISFTRYSRLPEMLAKSGFGTAAPDLCVEVIAESETAADMESKLRDYFDSGAEQVWHLLSQQRAVRVFLSPTLSTLLSESENLEAPDLLPESRVHVWDLFHLGLDRSIAGEDQGEF